MFNSIGAYFLFVIPMTIAIALGLIFEERLIEFEEKLLEIIKSKFGNISHSFQKSKKKAPHKTSKKMKGHEIRPLEMSA